MLLNHRRALRLCLFLLCATVAVFVLVATRSPDGLVQDVDDAFLRLMESVRITPLVWLSKAMAFIGGVWVNWPLRVIALVVLAVKRRWLQLAAFSLAIVSSELMIGTLKDLYERPRPSASLIGTRVSRSRQGTPSRGGHRRGSGRLRAPARSPAVGVGSTGGDLRRPHGVEPHLPGRPLAHRCAGRCPAGRDVGRRLAGVADRAPDAPPRGTPPRGPLGGRELAQRRWRPSERRRSSSASFSRVTKVRAKDALLTSTRPSA